MSNSLSSYRGKSIHIDLQVELESNRTRLIATALSIATALNDSLKERSISNTFRSLCLAVHQESQKRFPSSNFTGMSGLIFLRYVCPYIVSPQQYDLVSKDTTIKSTTLRSLVLIAKLLQVAASQSSFDGEKELHMVPFNLHIKDFAPVIVSFYESILNTNNTNNNGNNSNSNSGSNTNNNSNSNTSKKDRRIEKMYGDPSLRVSYTELILTHLLKNTGIAEGRPVVMSHQPTDPLRSTLSFVHEGLLLIQPRVNLSGMGLTQQEGMALAKKLQGNTTVTELDLSDNALGGAGIRSLLAQNKSIIKLDLRKNHFSSDDILHMSKAIKSNTTLQELLLDTETLKADPDAEAHWLSIEAVIKANRESEKKSGSLSSSSSSSIRRGIASITKSMLTSL